MKQSYDAVLFDFDGVIADSEPVHYACWKQALDRFHIDLDWESWARICIGVADRDMMNLLAGRCHPPADPLELWSRYPEKRSLYQARVLADPPIPREVRALVGELDGLKLAVVSSSLRAEVEPVLTAAGIRDRFDVIVAGEDVARHKPAADPYLLAAGMLDAQCPLVVEDSTAGIASARAAGFDWVRVSSPAGMPGAVRRALSGDHFSGNIIGINCSE